ncbi:MAG: DUF945 family protein [Kordiimonadaceae bacterium]|nr:DUF945 family protein [Kordiimonadaceae bacterium]
MKFSYILGGVLLAGVATQVIGAKIIGSGVESSFRTAVGAYSEQTNAPISISSSDVGWFSSRYTFSIAVPETLFTSLKDAGLKIKDNGEQQSFDFEVEATHGPLIFNDGLHFSAARISGDIGFDLDGLAGDLLRENLSEEELSQAAPHLEKLFDALKYNYSIDIGFDGNILFKSVGKANEVDLADISTKASDSDIETGITKLVLKNGASLSQWAFNSSDRTMAIDVDWDGLDFELITYGKEANNIEFSVGALDLSGGYAGRDDKFWVGDMAFDMKSFGFKMRSGEQSFGLALGEFAGSAATKAVADNDTLIQSVGKFGLSDIGFSFAGNEIKLDQFSVDVSVENLQASLLQAYNERSNKAAYAGKQLTPKEQFSFLEEDRFKTDVDQQLNAIPKISITDYSMALNGEEIGLKGFIQLNQGMSIAEMKKGQKPWEFFDGEFDFRLSPTMVKALAYNFMKMSNPAVTEAQVNQIVDAQIGLYSQQGFIVSEADNFISNVTLAYDLLTVNGRPIMAISQAMDGAAAK